MRTRRCVLVLTLLLALAPATSAEAKRLVRYDAGGGIAGMRVMLIVDDSGAARQTGTEGDHRFTVPSARLRALKRELREARFSSLRRSYEPDFQVFDGIGQSVTYRGRRVSVSTGADVPRRLERVFTRLARLTRSD